MSTRRRCSAPPGSIPTTMAADMTPLLDAILSKVPRAESGPDGPFQMRISSLDYSSYVGVIGIGRIARGSVRTNTPISRDRSPRRRRNARILSVLGHLGLARVGNGRSACRRHRLRDRCRRHRHLRHVCAPEMPRGAAAADGRRTDRFDDVLRQHVAVRRASTAST